MNKVLFNWLMWQGVGASCWFMWIASTFLSYWGFTRLAHTAPWWVKAIALGVSASINFVEFMGDNFSMHEFFTIKYTRDLILRVFWVVCYLYDIWTNILGFIGVVGIAAVSIIQAFHTDPAMTIFACMFGFLIAVGPEPMYILFLEKNFAFPGFGSYTPRYKTSPKAQPVSYQQATQTPRYSVAPKPVAPMSDAAKKFLQDTIKARARQEMHDDEE